MKEGVCIDPRMVADTTYVTFQVTHVFHGGEARNISCAILVTCKEQEE